MRAAISKLTPAARGILFLCTAVAIFSVQNALTKTVTGLYATHEILFIRGFFMVPVGIVIAYLVGEVNTLRTQYPVTHMLRSLALFGGFSGFFLGLSALPLANTVAIFFSAPLFVTLLSVFVLRESIGVHRISALIVGFLGVLVIVRPGLGDFSYASLFPLLGAMAYAWMPIITRKLGATESASVMSLYNALYNMLFAGTIGLVLGGGWFTIGVPGDPAYFLTRAWEMPHGWGWLIFLIIGITSACGSYLSTQAYRTAPASIITPFEYTALLWATLWGILVWGDMPDRVTLAGMCLVVGSGLYIVIRETILKRLEAKGKIVGTG